MPTNDDGETGPETITLWVVLPTATHAAAERVAKGYAPDGLEGVLTAFACDVAKTDDEPGPWSQNLVSAWLSTLPWARSDEGGKEGV